MNLVSDNGCQPTSHQFMKSCNILGVNQIFTSYNNPKGNAETERLMRTCKEELIWLQEWEDVDEARLKVSDWTETYNQTYLHSSIGYLPPAVYEKQLINEGVA